MDKLTLTDEQAEDLLAEDPDLALALVEVMRESSMGAKKFDAEAAASTKTAKR